MNDSKALPGTANQLLDAAEWELAHGVDYAKCVGNVREYLAGFIKYWKCRGYDTERANGILKKYEV